LWDRSCARTLLLGLINNNASAKTTMGPRTRGLCEQR
jgi:hypothetical protein